jgi:hypothetical protein
VSYLYLVQSSVSDQHAEAWLPILEVPAPNISRKAKKCHSKTIQKEGGSSRGYRVRETRFTTGKRGSRGSGAFVGASASIRIFLLLTSANGLYRKQVSSPVSHARKSRPQEPGVYLNGSKYTKYYTSVRFEIEYEFFILLDSSF